MTRLRAGRAVRLSLRVAPLAGAALAGAHFGIQQRDIDAYHPHPDARAHVTSMHFSDPAWDEFWCVDRSDVLAWVPLLGIPGTIADEIEENITGGGTEDWHATGGLRIYLNARTDERAAFDSASIDCDLLSPALRDKVKIEFRMRESNEVCDEDGESPYDHADWVGCNRFPNEGLVDHPVHDDFLYSVVELQTGYYDSKSLVNHELGHAFGLDDPGSPEECAGQVSIMHTSFYCGAGYDDLDYPSIGDLLVVGSIVNEK